MISHILTIVKVTMIFASQYVIRDIYRIVKQSPLKTREVIDKFSNRYPNDPGLQKIRKQFNEYLENPTRDKLDRIKTNLEKLIHSRKLGSYGGLDYLTYLRDRRPRYNMYVFMR